MLAATLNRVITIQKRTLTVDTLGTPQEVWSDIRSTRSGVYYTGGSKSWESDQQQELHVSAVVFIFRYMSEFNYDCRIKYDGDIYDITSIEKLGRRDGFRVVTRRRESDD